MQRSFSHNWLTIYLFLLMVFAQALFAQGSVTLRGKVYDENTKEGLPGANVEVKGAAIGASTDVDGLFIIYNVPAGQQTIEVTYIGYKPKTLVLDLSGAGTFDQNIGLSASYVEGEEVVVTAQAQGQLAAINQQLASDKIVNVVSEQRIQELPDFNAAQAISRLPGVSTLQSSGEANKIVVRGLAPQYNAVSVEGVRLASTGSAQIGVTSQPNITSGQLNNDRSVDLSMVTPYMIKTITVYKAITPDLDANVIGGYVDMQLREAPSGFKTDLLLQGGYTDKSGNYGNYRIVASGSNRFLGDHLGAYLLLNLEAYDRDADNMNAAYAISKHEIGENGFEPVKVRNVALNRHLETRKRMGGNLILDYRLPAGSLKSINMFSRLRSDIKDHRTILNYTSKNLDFAYREGVNTIDLAANSIDFEYDLRLLQLDLKLASTYSRNLLPEAPDIRFSQTGAIVGAIPDNVVPDSLLQQVEYRGDSEIFSQTLSLFSSDYKENNQALESNFKIPLKLGNAVSGFFKFGGEYRHEKRTNDQSTPYVNLSGAGSDFQGRMIDSLAAITGVAINPAAGRFPGSGFASTDPDLTAPFLDNRFGEFYWAMDPTRLIQMADYLRDNPEFSGRATGTETGGWFNGPFEHLPNDYEYIENYTAGYLMSELNFLDFKVVGGVRYEKVTSKYSANNMVDSRNPMNQPVFPITVEPENEFWLPMVQMRFKPVEWGDIRYAFTKTLARPDFHQLSPKHTIDFSGLNIWAGNPDLKPAEAFNHDLIFSFHGHKLGLLSIGGFYKTIRNFTYFTQYKLHQTAPEGLRTVSSFVPSPKDGATLYTYINSPHDATVKGLEIDFQTRFWYVKAPPFNGLVLGVNYTRIESDATYPWRDDITKPNPDFPPGPRFIVTTLDSTRKGRLINQPNDILNAYIGYDFKGFSARLSFLFQGNSVSNVGAFPEQDGFTEDFIRWDFSLRQKLPMRGLELFMDSVNLNNRSNIALQRSIGGFTNEQNYGLTANLGIRYRY